MPNVTVADFSVSVVLGPAAAGRNTIRPGADNVEGLTFQLHSSTQTAPHFRWVDATGGVQGQALANGMLSLGEFPNSSGLPDRLEITGAVDDGTELSSAALALAFTVEGPAGATPSYGYGEQHYVVHNPLCTPPSVQIATLGAQAFYSAPAALSQQLFYIFDVHTQGYPFVAELGVGTDNRTSIGANGSTFDGQLTVFPRSQAAKGLVIRRFSGTSTGNAQEWQDQNGVAQTAVTPNGRNWVLDTVSGTVWGTVGGAAGQKQSWWGVNPVTQPLFATGAGHTVDQLVAVLQLLGLLRQQ